MYNPACIKRITDNEETKQNKTMCTQLPSDCEREFLSETTRENTRNPNWQVRVLLLHSRLVETSNFQVSCLFFQMYARCCCCCIVCATLNISIYTGSTPCWWWWWWCYCCCCSCMAYILISVVARSLSMYYFLYAPNANAYDVGIERGRPMCTSHNHIIPQNMYSIYRVDAILFYCCFCFCFDLKLLLSVCRGWYSQP